MIDRLTLSAARVEAMAQGIRQVAALPDPVGEILREWTPPNGIRISKVRVPIGVIPTGSIALDVALGRIP